MPALSSFRSEVRAARGEGAACPHAGFLEHLQRRQHPPPNFGGLLQPDSGGCSHTQPKGGSAATGARGRDPSGSPARLGRTGQGGSPRRASRHGPGAARPDSTAATAAAGTWMPGSERGLRAGAARPGLAQPCGELVVPGHRRLLGAAQRSGAAGAGLPRTPGDRGDRGWKEGWRDAGRDAAPAPPPAGSPRSRGGARRYLRVGMAPRRLPSPPRPLPAARPAWLGRD